MTQSYAPGEILSMPAEAARRLLSADSGDGALLYLHLLRCGSLHGLNWHRERTDAALAALEKLGLAPAREKLEDRRESVSPVEAAAPAYPSEVITAALSEENSPFTLLADAVEQMLGKKLTVNDLRTLYTLCDHLAMAPEVILLVVGWCEEECRRKYGPGRKPFLAQIRKEAYTWVQHGIETAQQAEEHLRRLTKLRSAEGEILRILDLPQRPLVERERAYVSAWQDMGFDYDVLRIAYEKTVMQKGAMNWSYMNGILRRWHEKGLHTAAAIQAGDRDRAVQAGKNGTAAPVVPQKPEEERRAREDMERMRRLLAQMKEEE